MTVEQFAQMHTAETERFELVEGELIRLSSGIPLHGEVRDLILYFLLGYFRNEPIGEVIAEIDCRLGPNTIRCADVSVFLGERAKRIDMRTIPIPFAPDIAVEVLSPSEAAIAVNRKIHNYLDAGCQEVWLFDADNCNVFVHAAAAASACCGANSFWNRHCFPVSPCGSPSYWVPSNRHKPPAYH